MLIQTAAICCIIAILASAGSSDIRARRVDDIHWVVLLAVGIPVSAVVLRDGCGDATAMAYVIASIMMAAYMLTDLHGLRAVPFIALPGLLLVSVPDGGCLAIFVQWSAFLAMHLTGLLTGGADAKCLMSLSMVLPAWSGGSPYLAFVIALAALLAAVAWVPLVCLCRGGRGCTYPRATDRIDTTFEWPCGWECDGAESRFRPSPDRVDEVVERLKGFGIPEVRVTPVIPYVAFVAVAFVTAMIV